MMRNIVTNQWVTTIIIISDNKIDRILQLSIGTLSPDSQMDVSFQSMKKSICNIKTSQTIPPQMQTRSTSSAFEKTRWKTTKVIWSCSNKTIPTPTLGTSLSRAASKGNTRVSLRALSNPKRSLAIASILSAALTLKLATATTLLLRPQIRRHPRRLRITASETIFCRR